MDISDDKALEYFDRLELNAANMKMVLDKLLMLKMINKSQIKSEEFELVSFTKDLCGFNQNPDVTFEFEGADEIIVNQDKNRLQIILENIIQNSVYYSSVDRKKNPLVKIKLSEIDENVVISVTDNGIGIPKDLIPEIFNMFYRGTEYSEGNGLGLYLVKKSTEKLKGSVIAESQVNEYSKFIITLPKRLEAMSSDSPLAQIIS